MRRGEESDLWQSYDRMMALGLLRCRSRRVSSPVDGFRRKKGVTFVDKPYVATQMQDDHYKCRENYSCDERLSYEHT